MVDEFGNVVDDLPIGAIMDDTELYTVTNTPGAGAPSVLSPDYYRQKAVEFQRSLVLLDEAGNALYSVMQVIMDDETAYNEWYALLTEYNNKRAQFKLAAEAINFASSGLNAIGVNFPRLQIPGGLGNPAFLPIAAAVAGAVVLISWATGFYQTVGAALKRWQYLDAIQALPEQERAQAIDKLNQAELVVEKALAENEGGTLGSVATIAKWAALAAIAYFGFKIWNDMNRGRSNGD